MSTFLELCQSMRQEAGISGSGPSAVTGQTGMLKKVVDWVALAWLDIQDSRSDWLWMNQEFTFQTIASTGNYTAASLSITDFGEWERDSFRIYLTSGGVAGESELQWIDYDTWRSVYGIGTQTESEPHCFTIKPNKSIQLAPIPDGIYTVSGDYRQASVTLAANGDTPGMPSRFHRLIVYKALMYYGANEGAPEVYADAQEKYRVLRNALIRDQTPELIYGAEPLV